MMLEEKKARFLVLEIHMIFCRKIEQKGQLSAWELPQCTSPGKGPTTWSLEKSTRTFLLLSSLLKWQLWSITFLVLSLSWCGISKCLFVYSVNNFLATHLFLYAVRRSAFGVKNTLLNTVCQFWKMFYFQGPRVSVPACKNWGALWLQVALSGLILFVFITINHLVN